VGIPKDLVSKSGRRLSKSTPPTRADLLRGNSTPPLTDAERAGIRAAVVLANRDANHFEQIEQARLSRRAEAEDTRDKAILAEYEQRLKDAI
jgi:hypothetical protein